MYILTLDGNKHLEDYSLESAEVADLRPLVSNVYRFRNAPSVSELDELVRVQHLRCGLAPPGRPALAAREEEEARAREGAIGGEDPPDCVWVAI
eukprot:1506017-Amphidinium_carterae.1